MVVRSLRTRVERLLRGEFRNDDLTRLFLYARDRCDGRESVQEIGDFVAHHDERTKGIVTRTVRDWFEIVEFAMPRFAAKGLHPLDWERLPANIPAYLKVMMKRTPNEVFKKELGITRAKAQRLYLKAVGAIKKNADGTFIGPQPTNSPEAKLIHCLCRFISVQPAFTSEKLYRDFTATLRSHGLLKKQETNAFEELKTVIGLFAVTVMHNCSIGIRDGANLELKAMLVGPPNSVEVYAAVPIKNSGETNPVSVAGSIYTVPLPSADHCHPDLQKMTRWNHDLEITDDMRLTFLQ